MRASRRRALTALAAATLATSTALAEVSLRPGAGSSGDCAVVIQPTSRGAWSPVGRVSGAVLNPAGDLQGDGFPTVVCSAGGPLVGWLRPGTDQLLVARGTEETWAHVGDWLAPDAIGAPWLVPVSTGAAVAWTWDAAEPRSAVMVVSRHAPVGPEVSLGAGLVVGAIGSSDQATFVLLEPVGTITAETITFAISLPNDLIDVLGRSTTLVSVVDVSPVPGGTLGSGPVAESMRVQWHADDAVRPGGGVACLTWWTSTRTLAFVGMSASGPLLPVTTLGKRGTGEAYPPSLVRQALRAVALAAR